MEPTLITSDPFKSMEPTLIIYGPPPPGLKKMYGLPSSNPKVGTWFKPLTEEDLRKEFCESSATDSRYPSKKHIKTEKYDETIHKILLEQHRVGIKGTYENLVVVLSSCQASTHSRGGFIFTDQARNVELYLKPHLDSPADIPVVTVAKKFVLENSRYSFAR